MTPVVGVDGGGTHTRAVIVDEEGRELGRAQSRGAVVSAESAGEAVRAVSEAVRAAAERAGATLPVRAMWAGLAGAGLEAAKLAVARELGAAGLAEGVVVGTDVEAAFHDAFGTGPGVLLIAGTGSIAWARSAAGEAVRVGGWGERLGDEGSGFAIGMEALRAVTRAEDGRGPRTALRGSLLERLGFDRVDALISWVAEATKGDVAGLVPLVTRVSAAGDEVAVGLLATAVADLSAHLGAVLERAGPWEQPPELVLWGGLLVSGGPLHADMVQAVAAHAVRLTGRDVDAASGAARLALAGFKPERSEG